jgi:pyruvate carboxylase subunit B
VDLAKRLEDMGSDTLCIKDMAGLLSPFAAYDLISKIKKAVEIPIHLHSHDTSGMAVATTLKAIEAGVDIIDTASSPLASGTSHPAVEVLSNILKESKNDPQLNFGLLAEVADYFTKVRKKYKPFESEYTGIDPNVLFYQIPGGMTSNLATQLKDQNALHRMKEVLEEVPRVRKDFGYPPLVTPTSQIVGTQATLNVLTGERYKVITSETKSYLKGLYGKPLAPIDKEVRKKAIGNEEWVEVRPADLIPPELEKMKAEVKDKAKNIEDVLTYCLFPKVALEFFEKRKKGELGKDFLNELKNHIKKDAGPIHLAPSEFNIKVHGESYHIKIGGMGHPGEGGYPYFIYVDDQLEEVFVESLVEVVPSEVGRIDRKAGGHSARPKATEDGDVTTAMPGTVVSVKIRVGDMVKAGDTVLTVEAMKMENEIHTPINGEVKQIYVTEGDKVNPDEVLVVVRG